MALGSRKANGRPVILDAGHTWRPSAVEAATLPTGSRAIDKAPSPTVHCPTILDSILPDQADQASGEEGPKGPKTHNATDQAGSFARGPAPPQASVLRNFHPLEHQHPPAPASISTSSSSTPSSPSPDSGRSFDREKPVLKRRRITKACDFCHRRGRKCKLPSTTSPDSATTVTCLTCIEHGATCTWDRVAAKRGVKSKGPEVARKASSVADDTWTYDVARHGERGLIEALLRVFFDTVYPIFPFFAESVLVDEWERTSLSSSRPTFARLMAICALSSCHVRDGAVFSLRIAPTVPAKHQQSYLEDARRAIPSDISAADSFQYLQTLGTLSLAAIQLGDAPLLHETLGLYHTVMAQHNFQNESRWPSSIDPVEVHVRRQFFWSMYRLEVHSALIKSHSIRCPEMQAAVAYPAVSDALRDPIAAAAASRGGFPSGGWLIGWTTSRTSTACLSM
ncbi:uncharacterized protein VDAG_02205 [Verticillium dahliae VdLs.17]|uniref:Zn(2)-C6 fungal-type domain-containing protein n=1 Tax=Verticillium dahliae (strain VdLs.17 / ATCC MYA-4575 / FGSC 10137) TaxID=498257 RepID=G2WV64_VERDV|nr:uncharacterized protein VDAG_02205 [Verticillium dahliae VdLs.17]EGY20189.1 hypothetical protein VDAG_02205 [Verticillium dahliae VdLs.17]